MGKRLKLPNPNKALFEPDDLNSLAQKLLSQDAHNLLRPETVESLFVLWRVTGKQHFREWSWNIFRAFHRHSRVEEGGYANLDSCLSVSISPLSVDSPIPSHSLLLCAQTLALISPA